MISLLKIFFDVIYLVFVAALTTVSVLIDMGCSESKRASKNPPTSTIQSQQTITPVTHSLERNISWLPVYPQECSSLLTSGIVSEHSSNDYKSSNRIIKHSMRIPPSLITARNPISGIKPFPQYISQTPVVDLVRHQNQGVEELSAEPLQRLCSDFLETFKIQNVSSKESKNFQTESDTSTQDTSEKPTENFSQLPNHDFEEVGTVLCTNVLDSLKNCEDSEDNQATKPETALEATECDVPTAIGLDLGATQHKNIVGEGQTLDAQLSEHLEVTGMKSLNLLCKELMETLQNQTSEVKEEVNTAHLETTESGMNPDIFHKLDLNTKQPDGDSITQNTTDISPQVDRLMENGTEHFLSSELQHMGDQASIQNELHSDVCPNTKSTTLDSHEMVNQDKPVSRENEEVTNQDAEKWSEKEPASQSLSNKVPENLGRSLGANNLSEESDLSFLAPPCDVYQKEIISMGDEVSELKNTKYVNRLLYLLIAYEFSNSLTGTKLVAEMAVFLSCCTEQMKCAVYAITGDSLSYKIREFLTQFRQVFCLEGELVSKQRDSETWLKKSFLETLMKFFEYMVEQGIRPLHELCSILERNVGPVVIPWFGSVSPENLKVFIKQNCKTLIVGIDTVRLVDFGSSSGSSNRSSQKEVVAFFKEFLKHHAVSDKELSLVLSHKNPALLGALEDRKKDSILAMLLKDGSFKYENGMVMLKGYIVVIHSNPVQPAVPSLRIAEQETKTKDMCICSSGIVVSVANSRATFWCSHSEFCKNVFVVAKRSETVILSHPMGENFSNVFQEGDKVVFTSKTVWKDGWMLNYAIQVKIVEEAICESPCLCPKKKNMDVYLQQALISNGISHSDRCIFFWNCMGVVLDMDGTKGIVRCMLSESSDQYLLAYFTESSWVTGGSCGTRFAVGSQVEVDIGLNLSIPGSLSWYCVCLRNASIGKTFSSNILWNCSGSIVKVNSDSFIIEMDSCTQSSTKDRNLVVPLETPYLTNDGYVIKKVSQDLLSIGEKLTFDVETGDVRSVKFIRKCKRPASVFIDGQVDQNNTIQQNVSVVLDVFNSATPTFKHLVEKCKTNTPTYSELKTIQDTYFQAADYLQIQRIDYFSFSYGAYNLNVCDTLKRVKDSVCQTVSTGPIFSSLIPT